MSVSLLIFGISALGIIGLISMKCFEMRQRGKLLASISRRFDRKLYRYFRIILFLGLGTMHKSQIRIKFWVRVVLKRAVRNAYISFIRKISMHGQKIIDIERRERKLFKKRGAVSFFLKDIVTHKQALRK